MTRSETASNGDPGTSGGSATASARERERESKRERDTGSDGEWSGLERTIFIAIALAIALHPLVSVAEAITITTGYEIVTQGFWLALIGYAALLGYRTRIPLDSVGLFTAVTLLCWYAITWTGISTQRLEYAPSVLLGEVLALLAAVCLGIAVAFGDER